MCKGATQEGVFRDARQIAMSMLFKRDLRKRATLETWKSARSLSRLSSLAQRHRRQRYAPREVYCWRTSVYNCPFQSLCQWCSHSVFLLVSKSVNAFVTSNRHSHVCWIRADEKDRRLRIKMLLKCRCSLYACVCSATAVAVKQEVERYKRHSVSRLSRPVSHPSSFSE